MADTFGIVLLEAAAAGLPLISSPYAGATEDVAMVSRSLVAGLGLAAMAAAIAARGAAAQGRPWTLGESAGRLSRILASEDDSWVRSMAAKGLGDLGDRRAIPALTKAATDENWQISGAEKEALSRCKRD